MMFIFLVVYSNVAMTSPQRSGDKAWLRPCLTAIELFSFVWFQYIVYMFLQKIPSSYSCPTFYRFFTQVRIFLNESAVCHLTITLWRSTKYWKLKFLSYISGFYFFLCSSNYSDSWRGFLWSLSIHYNDRFHLNFCPHKFVQISYLWLCHWTFNPLSMNAKLIVFDMQIEFYLWVQYNAPIN